MSVTFFTAKNWQQTPAFQWQNCLSIKPVRILACSQFEQRRHEVDDVANLMGDGAGRDLARPTNDHRCGNAPLIGPCLELTKRRVLRPAPAFAHKLVTSPITDPDALVVFNKPLLLPFPSTRPRRASTIIGKEHHHRVIGHTRFIQCLQDTANPLVHPVNHRRVSFHAGLLPFARHDRQGLPVGHIVVIAVVAFLVFRHREFRV